MFQSFLSRLETAIKSQNSEINVEINDTLTSPFETSLLSPRSPFAWGATSPALSVFGALPIPLSTGTDREDMANAEEFARDVLVELIRGLLEDLRISVSGNGNRDDAQAQIKILSEIHRIMQQDRISPQNADINRSLDEPRTKAAFRELDGFLSVLNALSLLPTNSYPESTAQCVHLVFLVIAEALSVCIPNQLYFQTTVGWETLGQTLDTFVVSVRGLRFFMFSHLLCLALEDFETPFDTFFSFETETDLDSVDEKVSEIKALKETKGKRFVIRHPSAIRLLWDFVHNLNQRTTCYALYKVLEVLFGVCHRNGCVLASLAITGDVFDRFQQVRRSSKITNDQEDLSMERRNSEKEKHVLQRLLRRLLEISTTTTDARRIFQAAVVLENGKEKLDTEILEVIRFGMKSRWVEHFSFEGRASIVIADEQNWKTLPKEGMSLTMWFYLSAMPTGESSQLLFSVESTLPSLDSLSPPSTRVHMALSFLSNGQLQIYSSAAPQEGVVLQAKVRCARWTHLTLVWYPKMGGHPNLRLYLDGGLVECLQRPYPRFDSAKGSTSSVQYKIGDHTPGSDEAGDRSWCLASAHLLGFPLPSDIPRLIHHLGPRYVGTFQDPGIVRFLTYEAATSLNMYLAISTSPQASPLPSSISSPPLTTAMANKQRHTPLLKALREGLLSVGVQAETVLFGVHPSAFSWGLALNESYNNNTFKTRRHSRSWSDQDTSLTTYQRVMTHGDTFVVKAESLDDSLWKCGGAPVALRLVDLAETPHELSRTLTILTDGLKNSWQNSEDMERMRGYDILCAILRRKSQLINLTAFETLFEFFGLDFSVPEQSTIVNPLAYKAIALDFSLWAKTGAPDASSASSGFVSTTPRIPLVYLDHFTTLFLRSRYSSFNWTVGLGEGFSSSKKKKDVEATSARDGKGGRGVGLVRKMLFALQMGWFGVANNSQLANEDQDMTQGLVDALGVVLRVPGGFGKDDIKAIVAYLAANLNEGKTFSNKDVVVVPSSGSNNLQVRYEDGQLDGTNTPQSATSQISFVGSSPRVNAEKVHKLLLQLLSEDSLNIHQKPSEASYYQKFTSSLPINRILLLLLGDYPTSPCAAIILRLIGVGITRSPTFTRKFELVNGWNTLNAVVASISVWDREVDAAAWDLLLGNLKNDDSSKVPTPTSANSRIEDQRKTEVFCPQILPTILYALRNGLIAVADRGLILVDNDGDIDDLSWATETLMEGLIERIISMHASSGTFRHAFASQQTTQLFNDAYGGVIERLTTVVAAEVPNIEGDVRCVNGRTVRILEKMNHFGLNLVLDNAVDATQKQKILDKIRSAEVILNPHTGDTDHDLVASRRSVRQHRFNPSAQRSSGPHVGDRGVLKSMTRIVEWRTTIRTSEKKRLRKMMLDLQEFRRQVSRLTDWTHLLTSERALWPRDKKEHLWRLDETEGPHRIRKKLEYETEKSPSSRVDRLGEMTRDVRQPEEVESASSMNEVPPWADSYEMSVTEMEEQQQLAEEIVDDNLRRVRHELEPGDVIEGVATVARVDGVDAYPGLLIFGHTHIYMLQGIVENDDGEVVDAQEAPKKLFFIPGSRMELSGPQKGRRWPHTQLASYSEKKFLFRDVALEIYFKDSRSLLVVFLDKKKRTDFESRLMSVDQIGGGGGGGTPPSLMKRGSRLWTGSRVDQLSSATRKWQNREISNFAYLSILNSISGRTPSDATQYPVFPWVLSDYTSPTLDLNDPKSYRDLTKPMGGLTPARRRAAETRYESLQSVGEEPFHYGTHFSSSMIVCHFLIRLSPFTHMFKTLQGGDWDLPDRLFSDLGRAYESAAVDVRGDVRELIPEFYTCPEFLENTANHDFGTVQQTGERIHHVKLPPWARGDPLLFIDLNRKALESQIVSEGLPAWIDLIWGCKQRDSESLNVFHPLSYEGSIDLDGMKDDLERDATVGIIHNFGQTPRKLFNSPHPAREKQGLYSLPVGVQYGIEEDPFLLTRESRCFKDHGAEHPVGTIVSDVTTGKVVSCAEGMVCTAQHANERVEWGLVVGELRVVVDDKVAQVVEGVFVNCACFVDSGCLVTGSKDHMVRLWRVGGGGNYASATATAMERKVGVTHVMRVHTDEVVCVAASRAWSLVVSGSKDGSVALWDLNRGSYVRSIWHSDPSSSSSCTVDLVAINDSTGYIASCSRHKLWLHTVNGRPVACLDLVSAASSEEVSVTSLGFHEREYARLGVLATGSVDGSITLWTWTADGGESAAKWEFLMIRRIKVGRSAITALKFVGEKLYHGEANGKCYSWNLIGSS